MAREVLGRCPVCGEELRVSKLSCSNCHTNIEGNFTLCKFCKLSSEQKNFWKPSLGIEEISRK